MSFENYECEGQTTIFDFLPKSVEAVGFCDDPYCPVCNYWLDEIDADRCSECGTLLDWDRWHYISGE